MHYIWRAILGSVLLVLCFVARPAAAEVPCKLQLIRGSATVNGKPLSIATGMRLKVSVNYSGHIVQSEVVGGTPPYHYFFTIEAGTTPRRTINHEKSQSSPSFGMVLPSDVLWKTLSIRVQDATGKSVSSMGGAVYQVAIDPAANDIGLVKIGDVIETGPDTRLMLTFPRGASFLIKSNSRVILENEALTLEVGGMSCTMIETHDGRWKVKGPGYAIESLEQIRMARHSPRGYFPSSASTASSLLWSQPGGRRRASPEPPGGELLAQVPSDVVGEHDELQPGTKYYVETGKTGTSVYLSQGKARLTDSQGRRTVVLGPGQMSHVSPGGMPSAPQPYAAGVPEKLFENEALEVATGSLGDLWEVQEADWRGTWTRRQGTNTFDAVWQKADGQQQRDLLTIKSMDGNQVVLYRAGIKGSYYGTLSADGRSMAGTASWYKPGWKWSATLKQ